MNSLVFLAVPGILLAQSQCQRVHIIHSKSALVFHCSTTDSLGSSTVSGRTTFSCFDNSNQNTPVFFHCVDYGFCNGSALRVCFLYVELGVCRNTFFHYYYCGPTRKNVDKKMNSCNILYSNVKNKRLEVHNVHCH